MFIFINVKYVFSVQSSRYQVGFDGLMHSLEMKKVRAYDAGTVTATARNSHGDAHCSANLTVTAQEDFRSKLKQAPKCQ